MDLTERASQVVRQARDEARRLGDEHVGTDHLLLAMLRDADGAAAYVLDDFGVAYDRVFDRLSGATTAIDSEGPALQAPAGSAAGK